MQNEILIFTLTAITWILAEILKVFTYYLKSKKFDLKIALKYGGMPSSHTAFVTGLATTIFIIEGFTTAFLLSLAIWILVLRDLVVIRGHIDTNSKNIKKITKNKMNNSFLSHTNKEIAIGFLIGIITPFILIFLLTM
ncbi:MAG: divergent PAP2 family protein [Candidatus Woesearchaeota archaeon]